MSWSCAPAAAYVVQILKDIKDWDTQTVYLSNVLYVFISLFIIWQKRVSLLNKSCLLFFQLLPHGSPSVDQLPPPLPFSFLFSDYRYLCAFVDLTLDPLCGLLCSDSFKLPPYLVSKMLNLSRSFLILWSVQNFVISGQSRLLVTVGVIKLYILTGRGKLSLNTKHIRHSTYSFFHHTLYSSSLLYTDKTKSVFIVLPSAYLWVKSCHTRSVLFVSRKLKQTYLNGLHGLKYKNSN